MKLFLSAEGKNPESVAKLKSFVGPDLQEKKILYIPTGGNGEFYGSWRIGGTFNVVKSVSKQVKILELENYKITDINEMVKDVDIIWMHGGMAGYLLYWIRRTGFDKTLLKLLNKGILYVGSSSGGMICSKTIKSSEWYIGDEEPGAALLPGLGLVDFEMYPHYEEGMLSQIQEKWHPGDGKLYLLKNGEVITVVDGIVTVLGEERILEK